MVYNNRGEDIIWSYTNFRRGLCPDGGGVHPDPLLDDAGRVHAEGRWLYQGKFRLILVEICTTFVFLLKEIHRLLEAEHGMGPQKCDDERRME